VFNVEYHDSFATCDDGSLGSTTDQSVSGIFGGQSVTGTGFSASTEVSLAIIIAPAFHTQISHVCC
jgi:hypothetical protein